MASARTRQSYQDGNVGNPHNSAIRRGQLHGLQGMVNGQVVTISQGVLRGRQWKMLKQFPYYYAIGDCDLVFQAAMRLLLKPGDVFYDIGANAGFHSLVAASLVGEQGHVCCFEALPEIIPCIHAQMGVNGFKNYEVINAAVGDRTGTVIFHRHRKSNALGSIKTWWPSEQLESIEVESISLDDFIQISARRSPRLIKIDVEGAEDQVLTGAQKLIQADRPLIFYIELHLPESARTVLRSLSEAHYHVLSHPKELDLAALSPLAVTQIVAAHRNDPALADLAKLKDAVGRSVLPGGSVDQQRVFDSLS